MVNRESNVFPAILGRTCDRPCEPACRRGRVGDQTGNRSQARRHLPPEARRRRPCAARSRICFRRFPKESNGKRVALIGAGPASLTVANDLRPLGYEVTLFEKQDKPGGLMRTNIPSFRLPEQVLDDEVGTILDMGVDIRYNSPVSSLRVAARRRLRCGLRRHRRAARQGSRYSRPRRGCQRISTSASTGWSRSPSTTSTPSAKRVLIIGVGNTAMDCCRTSRRLGGKDIKVMARRPRGYFKASPWELDDAEEEGIQIIINHAPKRFVIEERQAHGHGVRTPGMGRRRQEIARDRNRVPSRRRCDPRHRSGKRVPLDRARSRHRVR